MTPKQRLKEMAQHERALQEIQGTPPTTPSDTLRVSIQVSRAYAWRLRALLKLLESPRHPIAGDHLVTLVRSAYRRRLWARKAEAQK